MNRTRFAVALVLAASACGGGGGDQTEPPTPSASGFTEEGGDDSTPDGGTTGETDPTGTTATTGPADSTETETEGSEDGEPPPPVEELCDAGDEAWVKRAVPFIQGRKPEGMREIRILVSAVAQLDAAGLDGRALVARALAQGEHYVERWKTHFFEHLRVHRTGDRLNYFCYGRSTDAANGPDLAAAIRDRDPRDPPVFTRFTMADVMYSALRLDDVSVAYRADTFARMAVPVTAGNVTAQQLEITNRANYGKQFESVHLGRTNECLQCHRADFATTYSEDPDENRHWPVRPDADLEHAAYGEFDTDNPLSEPEVHALFRHAGLVDYDWCVGGCSLASRDAAEGIEPWGLEGNCGVFRTDHVQGAGITLDEVPYMAGEFAEGPLATLFDLDPRVRDGLERLAADGLQAEADASITNPNTALAFMLSMSIAEDVWRAAQGFPLTVANRFPRNAAQRDILQSLTEVFYGSHYSPRALITAVATHPHFNQAPPDTCDASGPYHLAAVYDPFTREAVDPRQTGNGVGDMLHRFPAFVLVDAAAQSMWWPRAQRFGQPTEGAFLPAHLPPGSSDIAAYITQIDPDTGVNLQCCGAGYCGGEQCDDGPASLDFLRDEGVFVNDAAGGFNGVDFNGLLHWEAELGAGGDPGLGGGCTGPLNAGCSASDYVSALVAAAGAIPEAQMWDIAVALKDRLIAEPEIDDDAEIGAIEGVMLESLEDSVADVGPAAAEAAARRFAGLLLNTPQYMLDGIASRDQDARADPVLVVPGTDTASLCAYFSGLADASSDWSGLTISCDDAGITIEGKAGL